jgi:hypothetical protein
MKRKPMTQRQRVAKARADLIETMERWADAERRFWKTQSLKSRRDKDDAYADFHADFWNYAVGVHLGPEGEMR